MLTGGGMSARPRREQVGIGDTEVMIAPGLEPSAPLRPRHRRKPPAWTCRHSGTRRPKPNASVRRLRLAAPSPMSA